MADPVGLTREEAEAVCDRLEDEGLGFPEDQPLLWSAFEKLEAVAAGEALASGGSPPSPPIEPSEAEALLHAIDIQFGTAWLEHEHPDLIAKLRAPASADPSPSLPAELEEEELAKLEARYTPPEIPPCRVCGGELTIGKMGGGEPIVYHCSEASPLGVPAAERDEAWEHFRNSEFIDRSQGGDSRVVALVAEVRRLRAAYRTDSKEER